MGLTHGSLFSGIGGFDLGFQRAGIRTVWQVELDGYCRRVLEQHFPHAVRFADIRECGAHNLSPVDILSGGFPCQDISNAGKRAGIDGERSGLWNEYARIVCELRPRFVVVENVAALLGRGMERVLGDLAACGYDAEWQSIRASDVGAPHRRERIWIVAYPACDLRRAPRDAGYEPSDRRGSFLADTECAERWPLTEVWDVSHGNDGRRQETASGIRERRQNVADTNSGRLPVQGEPSGRSGFAARGGETLANPIQQGLERHSGDGAGRRGRTEPQRSTGAESLRDTEIFAERPGLRTGESDGQRWGRFSDTDWWATEPNVGRVANGIPARVDRLKGLGNAIIPQIAEFIGHQIVTSFQKP